jgi:hypothetical protein
VEAPFPVSEICGTSLHQEQETWVPVLTIHPKLHARPPASPSLPLALGVVPSLTRIRVSSFFFLLFIFLSQILPLILSRTWNWDLIISEDPSKVGILRHPSIMPKRGKKSLVLCALGTCYSIRPAVKLLITSKPVSSVKWSILNLCHMLLEDKLCKSAGLAYSCL